MYVIFIFLFLLISRFYYVNLIFVIVFNEFVFYMIINMFILFVWKILIFKIKVLENFVLLNVMYKFVYKILYEFVFNYFLLIDKV